MGEISNSDKIRIPGTHSFKFKNLSRGIIRIRQVWDYFKKSAGSFSEVMAASRNPCGKFAPAGFVYESGQAIPLKMFCLYRQNRLINNSLNAVQPIFSYVRAAAVVKRAEVSEIKPNGINGKKRGDEITQ